MRHTNAWGKKRLSHDLYLLLFDVQQHLPAANNLDISSTQTYDEVWKSNGWHITKKMTLINISMQFVQQYSSLYIHIRDIYCKTNSIKTRIESISFQHMILIDIT
jgi:ribosomal protein RSM22 (predicted rRNA methylase)